MSRWAWEYLDLAGVPQAALNPRSVSITRNLNDASTMQVVVEPGTENLSSTAAVVRGWRTPAAGGARVSRATGKVSSVQASAGTDALENLSLYVTDGFGVVKDRLHDVQTVFTATTPRSIITSLLASQNGRANTGMHINTGDAAGPPRDRTYERGKNLAEIITQLAEVDDGFYFRVDPDDSYELPIGWWYFSELVLLYPDPGSESSARFEWGEGTVGNLASVQADVQPPQNYVFAFGAGDGDEQLVSQQSDATSIATYGLYDVSASYSDVVDQTTLDQHALDLLRPAERRTFRVSVAPPTGNGELSVPSPWDDFDVGDTVHLNLRGSSAALQYEGPAIVTSFTVSVDANGVERLTGLDFQDA